MEGLRRGLAAVSAAVLAVSLASSLPVAATWTRLVRLARALSGSPDDRPDAMSFWFDPGFAAFLDDVKSRTPETATVAVLAPASPDLYLYQACYRLAPRRVVDERRQNEADAVATYGPESGRRPDGAPIAGGQLWIR